MLAGCVGFRYVVWKRWGAGKMRTNEMEQYGDQEQWSRKIRSSNSFCQDLVIFNPDWMLCCFRMAVFVVYSAEKLP